MAALIDRLALSDDQRAIWLESNDTYLVAELNKIFGKELFIRGRLNKQKGYDKAQEYFTKFPEVDYFIYSKDAPTHCGLVYTEKSRILFYRPGKSWGRSQFFRGVACKYVRLKKQILTIFEEEMLISVNQLYQDGHDQTRKT